MNDQFVFCMSLVVTTCQNVTYWYLIYGCTVAVGQGGDAEY